MKKINLIIAIISLFICLSATAVAGDLYKISLNNQTEAELLNSLGVEPVAHLIDGYLILADRNASGIISGSDLKAELIASNLSFDQLALDNRHDRSNIAKYEIIFEQGGFRLFKIEASRMALAEVRSDLSPIRNDNLIIKHSSPKVLNEKLYLGEINLDSLIGLVDQDSVTSNLLRLEAFFRRLTGTDSIHAARDWIAGEFQSYGYDSVVIDSFVYNSNREGQNVVAYKIGTRYPERQIIIGAHYDAVLVSPGADDNGSGTAAVLELARVLADIETEMTIIFIAFDAEEGGLNGSVHYANDAFARGDEIIYMLNLDMIGHFENSDTAKTFSGPDIAYSQLWGMLADSLAGIAGIISGTSGGSDHYPFQINGFDVTFVHEYIRSTHYHMASDSSTYLDFEYMTRMIKASLATVYTVSFAIPEVTITSIYDVGDGQSLQINWKPGDPAQVDHYWMHWTTIPATAPDSMEIANALDSSAIVESLIDNQAYSFYLVAFDSEGKSSIGIKQATAKPHSLPQQPGNLTALPLHGGVGLSWLADNSELDFSHYAITRDGQIRPDIINAAQFTDQLSDNQIHEYFVRAIDTSGNMSDTTGIDPVMMKAATLQSDLVLAVNRSSETSSALVDPSITESFLHEALANYNYDYMLDNSYPVQDGLKLLDMVDYGLLVLAAESARQDDIASSPFYGGVGDELAYYLDLGGKVIIFGRWGDLSQIPVFDSILYPPSSSGSIYNDYFNIALREMPRSMVYHDNGKMGLISDFVGAHSQQSGYPDLVWDSVATMDHTGTDYTGVSGIPCPTIPVPAGAAIDILYTYNSSSDSADTEGKPLAWRYLGAQYEYIVFDIPLSFMERQAAVAALRRAVEDMGQLTDANDFSNGQPLPGKFSLAQNYPNPFNPITVIEFYNPESVPVNVSVEIFNILGQKVKSLFDDLAQPGRNRVEWNGTDEGNRPAATGIYFYRLKTDRVTLTRQMVLLK